MHRPYPPAAHRRLECPVRRRRWTKLWCFSAECPACRGQRRSYAYGRSNVKLPGVVPRHSRHRPIVDIAPRPGVSRGGDPHSTYGRSNIEPPAVVPATVPIARQTASCQSGRRGRSVVPRRGPSAWPVVSGLAAGDRALPRCGAGCLASPPGKAWTVQDDDRARRHRHRGRRPRRARRSVPARLVRECDAASPGREAPGRRPVSAERQG